MVAKILPPLAHSKIETPIETNSTTDLQTWIYNKVSPYIQGNILHFGSCNNLFTSLLVYNHISITLSSLSETNCEELKNIWQNKSNIKGILQTDPFAEFSECELQDFSQLNKFRTILYLNTDSHQTLHNPIPQKALQLLCNEGHLVMTIPVHTALYNQLDTGLNYWHKQNKKEISKMLNKSFQVVKLRYFEITSNEPESSYSSSPKDSHSLFQNLVPKFKERNVTFKNKVLYALVVAKQIKPLNT